MTALRYGNLFGNTLSLLLFIELFQEINNNEKVSSQKIGQLSIFFVRLEQKGNDVDRWK